MPDSTSIALRFPDREPARQSAVESASPQSEPEHSSDGVAAGPRRRRRPAVVYRDRPLEPRAATQPRSEHMAAAGRLSAVVSAGVAPARPAQYRDGGVN